MTESFLADAQTTIATLTARVRELERERREGCVVKLPEPDSDLDGPEWDGQDDHVGWWVGIGISTQDNMRGVLPVVMGDWLHPNAARRFAAALLAAAAAAQTEPREDRT